MSIVVIIIRVRLVASIFQPCQRNRDSGASLMLANTGIFWENAVEVPKSEGLPGSEGPNS